MDHQKKYLAKRVWMRSLKGLALRQRSYWRHRPKILVKNKIAYAKNKARNQAYARKFNYKKVGISLEDYAKMLEYQKGLCAICEKLMKVPQLDHDHKTNKARALLCQPCNNRLLPIVEYSNGLIQKAINYLKKYGGPTHVPGTPN